jgi:L-asparagine transporter-like permease
LLISIGKLDDLATVTVMLLLIVFALVNVSVLVLRRDAVAHDHFVAPRFAPVLGIVISLVLLVKRITEEDVRAILILVALLVIAVLLWAVTWLFADRQPQRTT